MVDDQWKVWLLEVGSVSQKHVTIVTSCNIPNVMCNLPPSCVGCIIRTHSLPHGCTTCCSAFAVLETTATYVITDDTAMWV